MADILNFVRGNPCGKTQDETFVNNGLLGHECAERPLLEEGLGVLKAYLAISDAPMRSRIKALVEQLAALEALMVAYTDK